MVDLRDRGIVMRLHPYSDTSSIVHWLTVEHGRIATLARGARRPKSPFHGKLDLLVEAELSVVPARRSNLHTLREVVPDERHADLRGDYQKLLQAAYAVALIERGSETDTPIPELFALFTDWLREVEGRVAQPRWVLAFEARLLASLGLDPVSVKHSLSPESEQILGALTLGPWSAIMELQASSRSVRQVREFLRSRLVEAFGAVPPSRSRALGIEPG